MLRVLLATLITLTVQSASAQECVTLDDFSSSVVGAFPMGWRPRNASGMSVYRVQLENGTRYVSAKSKGLGVEADHRMGWDVAQYPVLTWKWRPKSFPSHANERSGHNDSALGVYVGFDKAKASLKYIWSEQVELGAEWAVGLFDRTKMHVLVTGSPADASIWHSVRVDIANDYRRRLGRSLVEPAAGISILTDADDTHSTAAGDYADFRACTAHTTTPTSQPQL